MKKILLLGVCLIFASVGLAKDMLVKYPPMTAEEIMELTYAAAEWFEKEVEEGRTQEALAEFQKAPVWKLNAEGWARMEKEIDNSELIEYLQPFRNKEFTETEVAAVFSKVKKVSDQAWKIAVIATKNAEKVSDTPWTQGSIADYRLVVIIHCEKKVYNSHPFFPSALNKPIVDKIKDDNGKRYMWEVCNTVRKTGKGVWADAITTHPFPMHREKMDLLLVPVGKTGYQAAALSRNLERSVAELNALIK